MFDAFFHTTEEIVTDNYMYTPENYRFNKSVIVLVQFTNCLLAIYTILSKFKIDVINYKL